VVYNISMHLEQSRPGLPFGIRHNQETLPAAEVQNHVVWANKDLDFPFALEELKPTKLGLFLSVQNGRARGETKLVKLGVKKFHGRSATLGRIIFGEKNNTNGNSKQLFRDIDIKGLGYVNYAGNPIVGSVEPRNLGQGQEAYGILDLEDAMHDKEISETFHRYGIRTCRVVAVILLKEIWQNGSKLSIEEAKQRGIIPNSIQPALEVRAFGTHTRFVDVINRHNSYEKRSNLVEDARIFVAQQLGKSPKEFGMREYSLWLTEMIGKNVGLMHKNGYVHQYLRQGHNITLDGCLVDFDSVEKISDKHDPKIEDDYLQAESALRDLFKTSKFYSTGADFDKLFRVYKNAYEQYSH